MFPEFDVAQHMTMKRSKTTHVMQEGISHEERHEVAYICRKHKFSIIIDECTDISVSQILAVVVSYSDEKTQSGRCSVRYCGGRGRYWGGAL